MGNNPSNPPQIKPDWNLKNGPGTIVGGAAGAAVGHQVGGPAGSFIGSQVGSQIGKCTDVVLDMQGRQIQSDYQQGLKCGMQQADAARYATNVNNVQ